MPSPFPGMNPYLEQEDAWHKFHEQFCIHCMELLVPQVRPNYIVELDEHVFVQELPADERRLIGRSDLSVVRRKPDAASPSSNASTLTAPAYAQLPVAIDIERLSSVVIKDRKDRSIVTVVELLSPSNKSSDRPQYLAKRHQYFSSGVSLVEIDLLRGGLRLPLEGLNDCDYYVMSPVRRNILAPESGRFTCAIHCRKYPCPSRAATPTRNCNCRKCCTSSTTAAAMKTTSTPANPSRP
ncbi:MAG TPA: DUF4058 family protein [Humisphaera sp.]|jgi:hypothetical protein|nr:DUF4058 family protein [Humisphaera sp.]